MNEDNDRKIWCDNNNEIIIKWKKEIIIMKIKRK